MTWLAASVLFAATSAGAVAASAVDMPSGQSLELQEVLVDQVATETWLRFRFVAPYIARDTGAVDFAQVGADMTYLCDALAIPYMAQHALNGEVIVISLADRVTEFGVSDPEATQFFEAFRLSNDTCIWEGL
ncbi:MAG TPA: hypothetical protein ENH63_08495 [Sulfitobacter litoralis]|uniref:Acetolactate synthase n=1 Tax=Sulfitobacter litoralis TaxID=335975 RepID=A0A7V1BFU9_9RHOB|nr:hypothetical protein [Sulfitobacter litoralis]